MNTIEDLRRALRDAPPDLPTYSPLAIRAAARHRIRQRRALSAAAVALVAALPIGATAVHRVLPPDTSEQTVVVPPAGHGRSPAAVTKPTQSHPRARDADPLGKPIGAVIDLHIRNRNSLLWAERLRAATRTGFTKAVVLVLGHRDDSGDLRRSEQLSAPGHLLPGGSPRPFDLPLGEAGYRPHSLAIGGVVRTDITAVRAIGRHGPVNGHLSTRIAPGITTFWVVDPSGIMRVMLEGAHGNVASCAVSRCGAVG